MFISVKPAKVPGLSDLVPDIPQNSGCIPDKIRFRPGANIYSVLSFDKTSVQFSLPILVKPGFIPEFYGFSPEGYDGFTASVIEHIKRSVPKDERLRALGGLDTVHPAHYSVNTEPVTVIKTSHGSGQRLWMAGADNFTDEKGLHLTVRGALPAAVPGSDRALRQSSGYSGDLKETVASLVDGLPDAVAGIPVEKAEEAVSISVDQKKARSLLADLGLVSFIADGSLPARHFSDHRSNFRLAGPKYGVNIAFRCPKNLSPIEIEYKESGYTLSGLGIKKSEVFAVVGSNAEGKSTFLQGIISGTDDHLPGDGREGIVTVGRGSFVETGGRDISGSDISLFFKSLPPGISGTPKRVSGTGSGSMVMAAGFSEALSKQSPYILFDEDRSATNLLVPNCIQCEDVSTLTDLLRERREIFSGTSLIFAAATMDLLIAHSDRIMRFNNHRADGILVDEYRKRLHRHMTEIASSLINP
ncbi:ABC transporter, ATPase [Methanoplanus limicola DSM 2279]|uniref:ABC transporter, ATPase n=1 Tax=Methanoplanus limicola DSM 2279 TaxID=937775 RepID=H1YXF8_9EURY|nr:ABC transporter, ATPase [Methanoplanus limicola DSM 2279]